MNWAAFFTHPINDPGPWTALATAAAIVVLGYWEMFSNRSVRIGLTTWVFAIGPFLVAAFWIVTWTGIGPLSRILLIATLVAATWFALSRLYQRAKRKIEEKKL